MKNQMRKAAWIVSLVWTIFNGLFIIPLAWMIPMNVMLYKAYKEDRPVSPLFMVLYAIFCYDMLTTTILLCSSDRAGRRTYIKVMAVVSTVLAGSTIIPLAWMIPMTVAFWKHADDEEALPVAFGVCWFLFFNSTEGIFMLVEHDA